MSRRKEPVEETDRQRVERVMKDGPKLIPAAATRQQATECAEEFRRDLEAIRRYFIEIAMDKLETY